MTKDNDMQNDNIVAYEVITAHYLHAEQVRWAIIYNFLTANMILVLGWAAIFASTINPSTKRVVLGILCVAGIDLHPKN